MIPVEGIPLGGTPEQIEPGIAYYSDDYVVQDNISDLGGEKNLEEVYQNYSYYEAIYDEQKRVVLFRAYKQDAIGRTERYFYKNGKLIKKEITSEDQPAQVITFD